MKNKKLVYGLISVGAIGIGVLLFNSNVFARGSYGNHMNNHRDYNYERIGKYRVNDETDKINENSNINRYHGKKNITVEDKSILEENYKYKHSRRHIGCHGR